MKTNFMKDPFEKPCKECGDDYRDEEMPHGLCPDCQDNFDSMDLEDRLEKALGY